MTKRAAVYPIAEAYLHTRVKDKEGHLTARKQRAARQRGESASTTTTTSSQKTRTPAGESDHMVRRSLRGYCGGKTRQMTGARKRQAQESSKKAARSTERRVSCCPHFISYCWWIFFGRSKSSQDPFPAIHRQ